MKKVPERRRSRYASHFSTFTKGIVTPYFYIFIYIYLYIFIYLYIYMYLYDIYDEAQQMLQSNQNFQLLGKRSNSQFISMSVSYDQVHLLGLGVTY